MDQWSSGARRHGYIYTYKRSKTFQSWEKFNEKKNTFFEAGFIHVQASVKNVILVSNLRDYCKENSDFKIKKTMLKPLSYP